MSADRVGKLNSIGFVWNKLKVKWDAGYNETVKYLKKTQSPNAPTGYVQDGFMLGRWQISQRILFKRGNLSEDRINRLNAIGFAWDILEEHWEKGYRETHMLWKKHGTANVPVKYVQNGYKLGIWQMSQKVAYKKGRLTKDQIND